MNNVLILRNCEDSIVFAAISGEDLHKIRTFDKVKRKHHITGFEYIHPDDRKDYALDLLGLEKNPNQPIIGDNVVSLIKGECIFEHPVFSECFSIYFL